MASVEVDGQYRTSVCRIIRVSNSTSIIPASHFEPTKSCCTQLHDAFSELASPLFSGGCILRRNSGYPRTFPKQSPETKIKSTEAAPRFRVPRTYCAPTKSSPQSRFVKRTTVKGLPGELDASEDRTESASIGSSLSEDRLADDIGPLARIPATRAIGDSNGTEKPVGLASRRGCTRPAAYRIHPDRSAGRVASRSMKL